MPSLTLDGGSLLFKTKRVTPGLAEKTKITAAGIIDAYNIMGYHAVGITRHDLAGGLAFLRQMNDRAEFPLLAANVITKSTRKPIFTPQVIQRIGDLAIGIIGITDPEPPSPFTAADDAEIIPWSDVLPGAVAELTPKCDMIVLLSNQKLLQNKEIVQTVPGIHLIIQAGTSSANLAPIKINNTLIVQTASQGKYLGWMQINWLANHEWADDTLKEDLALKKKELAAADMQKESPRKPAGFEDTKADDPNQTPAVKREQLLDEIQRLETVIAEQNLERPTSTYVNHFIALDTNLPENPQVLAVVEETKKRLNALGN